MKLKTSAITACFASDVYSVWEVVTNNYDSTWRSDLLWVEVSDDGWKFTEYTKSGLATIFTITLKQPYACYEFDLENKHICGHWKGYFETLPEGGCRIRFVEEVKVKNPFMRLLAILFMDLKKMQRLYIRDLREKLRE